MLIERKINTLLGANITGGEGGSGVVCYKVDDGSFRLAVVDPEGKVISTDRNDKIQILAFRDLERKGVGVWLADGKTKPIVRPHKTLKVQVGPHTLTFEGTSKPGIEFNGQKPTQFTPFIDKIRYPELH